MAYSTYQGELQIKLPMPHVGKYNTTMILLSRNILTFYHILSILIK